MLSKVLSVNYTVWTAKNCTQMKLPFANLWENKSVNNDTMFSLANLKNTANEGNEDTNNSSYRGMAETCRLGNTPTSHQLQSPHCSWTEAASHVNVG